MVGELVVCVVLMAEAQQILFGSWHYQTVFAGVVLLVGKRVVEGFVAQVAHWSSVDVVWLLAGRNFPSLVA